MRRKPVQLLAHVGAGRHHQDFLRHAIRVRRNVFTEFGQPRLQPVPHQFRLLRCESARLRQQLFGLRQHGAEELQQALALFSARGGEHVERGVESCEEILRHEIIDGRSRARCALHHAGGAEQSIEPGRRDARLRPVARQPGETGQLAGVYRACARIARPVDAELELEAAALEAVLHALARLEVDRVASGRIVGADVHRLAVDRARLPHPDAPWRLALGPSETCHPPDHRVIPRYRCCGRTAGVFTPAASFFLRRIQYSALFLSCSALVSANL